MQIRLKKLLPFIIIATSYSCSSKLITPTTYSTTEQLQLGEIGEDKNFVLEKNYNHTAIPIYNKPVKVNVQLQEFKTSSYRAFKKANAKQNDAINISYSDSLDTKPRYLKLSLADRVAVLNALNSEDNKDVKQYLHNKYDAHVISNISIAFSKQLQNSIIKADEIFIKTYGVKSYALHLYTEGVLVDTIPFTEGVVFNYKTSNLCWKEIRNSTWNLADIVEQADRCPKDTYRSPKKDKKVKDYLKF